MKPSPTRAKNILHLPIDNLSMGNFFNYNGKIFIEGTPVIGADSRALRYGDGLFETFKIKNNQIVFGDEHFARLWKGMQILCFDIPKHFTPENLQADILALAKKNGHNNFVRVRLNVFRGDGGLNDAINLHPNYIIQTWELPESNGVLNINGLVIGVYTEAKKNCDILSNIKHNNYLVSVMAAIKAKEEQWNDAVILNNFDRICETSIANIFLIKDGVLITPSKTEGCVEGVMKNHLIKELRTGKWLVEEKPITQTELLNADEVFITNSIYNIRWVKQLGSKVFDSNQIQKIYTDLSSTFL